MATPLAIMNPKTLQISRYDAGLPMPPHLEAQIRTLLTAQWPGDEDETNQPLMDSALSPVYFVLGDGEQVFSYARTIRASVSHLGQNFLLYGLGDVITKPEFRHQGCGRRVVAVATAYIQADHEADAAILQTVPELEAFYNHCGWVSVPGLRVTTNELAEASFPMMLWLSDIALSARATFTKHNLVLPGNEW